MAIFEPNYFNLEYFFNLIYKFLLRLWPFILAVLAALAKLRGLMIILSLALMVFIGWLVYKINQLRSDEVRSFLNLVHGDSSSKAMKNDRWAKIVQALDSDNPSDWKQAVIDADIMLDEMVKAMNYPGETLGERLKAIEPSDFLTLQDAWEAHKIRNQIAHESAFTLSRREARQALDRFERVFREFAFI